MGTQQNVQAKIRYDSVKESLFFVTEKGTDYSTLLGYSGFLFFATEDGEEELIYMESHDSEIDLVEVAEGKVKWDDGKTDFTLEDFVGECLGFQDFEMV